MYTEVIGYSQMYVRVPIHGLKLIWLISQRNEFDITQTNPDPFPPPYHIGYLNSKSVQEALGVPRNFTPNSFAVQMAYDSYDPVLGGHLEDMGFLLDSGVTVALVYGDRDYSNNCKFHYWLMDCIC